MPTPTQSTPPDAAPTNKQPKDPVLPSPETARPSAPAPLPPATVIDDPPDSPDAVSSRVDTTTAAISAPQVSSTPPQQQAPEPAHEEQHESLRTPPLPPAANPSAESQVLRTLVETGVRPALFRLADTGNKLAASIKALCGQPSDAQLEQARRDWHAAYRAWRGAEPYLFGPMAEMELEKRIGSWPPNRTVLDAAAATDDMQDLLRGNDVRGYAAIEYLLFSPTDAAAVVHYCVHLEDITAELSDLTIRTRTTWLDGYEQRFLAAGDGNPFLLPGDALSLPFAEALNVTERMLRDRIGYPSGVFDGELKPDSFEAATSGTSLEGLQATLEGLQTLVVGNGETGVTSLIATRDGVLSKKNPKLSTAVTKRLRKLIAALDSVDAASSDRIEDHVKLLKRLYRQTEQLQEQLVEATLVLELNVL